MEFELLSAGAIAFLLALLLPACGRIDFQTLSSDSDDPFETEIPDTNQSSDTDADTDSDTVADTDTDSDSDTDTDSDTDPVVDGTRDDGFGLGCHLYNGPTYWWLSTPDFNPAHSYPMARIVCGCNPP